MKLTQTQIRAVVTHEVGHLLAVISNGLVLDSYFVSSNRTNTGQFMGQVQWKYSGSPAAREGASRVAIAGITADWVRQRKNPLEKFEWFREEFMVSSSYSQDKDVYLMNRQGTLLITTLSDTLRQLESMKPWAKRLIRLLMHKDNMDRIIPQKELLGMAGIRLLKNGSDVDQFVEGCSYFLSDPNA